MAEGVTQTCRSCEAPVIFVPSATSGKPMILDAKPEKRVVQGHHVIGLGAEEADRQGTILVGVNDPTLPRVAKVVDAYTDHHVTCPKAADWRGKTRREGAPA